MPSAPGRSNAAAVAVLALVALAGVAVYGVITVARSTPTQATAAQGGGGGEGATVPKSTISVAEVLAKANAMAASNNSSPAEIIALVEPAVESNPEIQDLRLALAHAYYVQKDWANAYKAFDAAIAIGPDSAALQSEAGTVANAAGLLDRAVEHYGRAKQLEPKNPLHPLYLGMVQIKAGKDREAMTSLVTATVLNPDLGAAWGSMGELELRNNQLDLALQHIEKARKLEPDSVKWRIAEAKIHKRQNEPAKALDLLVNLPEKQRYSADAIPVVADALAMLKQPDKRTDYAKAAADFARKSGDQKALEQAERITQPQ